MQKEIKDEIAEVAEIYLADLLAKIPKDSMSRIALFVETMRVFDYWTVIQPLLKEEHRIPSPDFEIIQWGWNLAIEHLFSGMQAFGVPIYTSTDETRDSALKLLYAFGVYTLLCRSHEMVRHGALTVEQLDNTYIFQKANKTATTLLDNLEFAYLEDLESRIEKANEQFNGWRLFGFDEYPNVENEPGAFFARQSKDPFVTFQQENIDEIMAPLIFPWDSGKGIMMGYSALPEVDDHFLSQATQLIVSARSDAGIHPDAQFGNITGADLTAIIAVLTSLHSKHIRFAMLAKKHHPEISIPQSLTIWGPYQELIDSIADYTPLDKEVVKNAIHAITLFPSDTPNLHKFTTPFVPLLISLENDFVLRPVSSIYRNPFISTVTLMEWRNPKIVHKVSEPREDWMREELYALFQGSRYLRVDGNVKLRIDGNIITDVDGAIFDILTGELALFQIKWQDYFTNDTKKLRSKARNLAKEIDNWAEKVSLWIETRPEDEILKSFRLGLSKAMPLSRIYLFGISRNMARVQGYGFDIKSSALAIANWPQLKRVRFEVGPADQVFSKLHSILKEQMLNIAKSKPIEVSVKALDKKFIFKDLWNAFEILDDDEQE